MFSRLIVFNKLIKPSLNCFLVPDSAPQELTISDFTNTSSSLVVAWQPPLHPNGDVTRKHEQLKQT